MKSLKTYITEAIKHLAFGTSGIIVFDIDDTLIKADSSIVKIHKYVGGDKSNVEYLSTEEYAKDPDVVNHPDWFNFDELKNPTNVIKSIIKGTPLLKNLKILDAYVNAGYEFCFLTARGCEDAVKYAIGEVIKYRDVDGLLKDIKPKFNEELSAAVNDVNKHYKGQNDPEKKANVLRELCEKFDRVVFVDDDKKNVKSANGLGLKNLTVIQAWK